MEPSNNAKPAAELLPLLYAELRKLAASRLAQESPGQTLQPTALVHEAYLRLQRSEPNGKFDNQGHFFAAAAEAMRRILIEQARHKGRNKRGGGRHRVALNDVDPAVGESPDDWLDLDEALTRLAQEDPEAAEVAKLRIFAGLSVDNAGDALGMSRATAYRHWKYARAWLRDALQ